jgi:hypothetical protein
MEKKDKILSRVILIIIFFLILFGIIIDGFYIAFKGFLILQIKPARLINDFMSITTIGSTLINGALVGLFGYFLVKFSKVKLSGPTFAAIFTLIGFGFFGKTVINIIPIIIGVYLSAKFVGKNFRDYLIIALFGTALGPLVSFFVFEFQIDLLNGIILSIVIGISVGFLLPAIAVSMLHIHQGYNLYNMGLTCGFVGLFVASFVKSTNFKFQTQYNWFNSDSIYLIMLIPIISIFLILTAFFLEKKRSLKKFLEILKNSGRLPSDFMDLTSIGGTFINCGLLGLLGSLYIYLVNGDFNGPTIGGLFTIMGFGAFGTHLKNSFSVVLGVILACLYFKVPFNNANSILAVIFVTTLSPIAGEFGYFVGVLAGITHLAMVLNTGSWHGGMNLYNNGFAGGLTAAFFIAIIEWYDVNKS